MPISKENTVFVYRQADDDSLTLAGDYQTAHNLNDSQLIPIPCSDTEILANEVEFNAEVLTPLKNALNSLSNIWVIVLGLNVPGGFRHGGDIISSTSRISRINHSFSKKKANFLYNRSDFKRFDSTDADFALIVARMDGPDLVTAQKMITNSTLLRRQTIVNGKFYVDPYAGIAGDKALAYQDEILDFQTRTLPGLNLPTFSTVFLDTYTDVVIPAVANDSFVWSWIADRADISFFNAANTIRTFLYNADYDGAETIRDGSGKTWPILAIKSEYASTAGAMSNPGFEGFLRPRPFFESLLNAATLGEAYLFSVPFLDWTMTFFGDPLAPVVFPANETVTTTTDITEDESWRRMSVDLGKAIAYTYRIEDALERVRDRMVLSTDIRTEVDMLIPSVNLYDSSTVEVINGDFFAVSSGLFEFIEKRNRFVNISRTFISLNDYLSDNGFKLSEVVEAVSKSKVIDDDNIFEVGLWEFEFAIADDAEEFVTYHFRLQISNDSLFTDINIDVNSQDSVVGWFYEKDVNEFVAMPSTGVPSNFVSRRVKYVSTDTQLLTRTSIYFPRAKQSDADNVYEYRMFGEDIIFT